MKKNNLLTIGLLAGAYLLFSSFKNKTTPTTRTGTVYVGQGNAPTGTTQVFSLVGTCVYDANTQPIYTYDTANLGMTVTGDKGTDMYAVVIGDSFMSGTSGFVYKNQVQSI